MNTATVLETLESETKPETRLYWMVECPLTGGLAEVEVGARAAPFASFCMPRVEVRSCSLWPEQSDCGHRCLKGI